MGGKMLRIGIFVLLAALSIGGGVASFSLHRRAFDLERKAAGPASAELSVVQEARLASEVSRTEWWAGLCEHLCSEMSGAIVVFLLIETLLHRRERKADKREDLEANNSRLALQAGSADNGLALQALRELRAAGALSAGILNRHELSNASFEGADMEGASLQFCVLRGASMKNAHLDGAKLCGARIESAIFDGASMVGTNLEGVVALNATFRGCNLSLANLKDAILLTSDQLRLAAMLWGATMPDGSRYDGSFDLPGDIEEAARWNFVYSDSKERARFYAATSCRG
jgi:uncharacterized protein YjbI with pentapeptide repeats